MELPPTTTTTTTSSSSTKSRRFQSSDEVQQLIDKLCLENVSTVVVDGARSLVNKCASRQIGLNSRARAALALQVSLGSRGPGVQDDLIRFASVSKKDYLREMVQVKALCANTEDALSVTSLCLQYGCINIQRDAQNLLRDFIAANPESKAKQETVAAVFLACAQAAGEKTRETKLITDHNLNATYFHKVWNILMKPGFHPIFERIAQNTVKGTPGKSTRASRATGTTPKASSSSSATTPTRGATRSRAQLDVMDNDDDEDDFANVAPPPPPRSRTPQPSASLSAKRPSAPSTPSTRTATQKKTGDLDDILIHGAVAPAAESVQADDLMDLSNQDDGSKTPVAAKRVARGGFRSKNATPMSTKSKRKHGAVTDEDNEEDDDAEMEEVDECPRIRNPLIANQSLINRLEDEGRSKRCQRVDKWLQETRILVAQKLKEKAELAQQAAEAAAAAATAANEDEME
ncbi:hypothetical protein BCR33DRAFT_792649 [Rhizoclosmatium globosum]|uniref:ORC6 second cyclin-like domain-containing protein n=1 Tax=Rhizoclosmatium globosum TaxID=329046 RepID=A0A1Y2B630_9FUNG|nr:hypothetical protein BCR33DRAFT_792649 [Rhizoclosmatium globosum]|eukprot:ORY30301.1 hypothetical protein BCR33DRAFT_792649 [Rhizoclosmatium globosum]